MVEKPNIPSALPAWARCIKDHVPHDEREAAEQKIMLDLIEIKGDALLCRDCAYAHMTSSSMIVNRDCTKVLMAYHRIYNSWAWTGGHNDGDSDFFAVAMREAQEETGIRNLIPLSKAPATVEVLHVLPHMKRGKWVGTHLHLNVSYLFMADENASLRIAEDENSAVGWIPVDAIRTEVAEEHMFPTYEKLIALAKQMVNIC